PYWIGFFSHEARFPLGYLQCISEIGLLSISHFTSVYSVESKSPYFKQSSQNLFDVGSALSPLTVRDYSAIHSLSI
ncbi:MAG: hypothetical protein ACPH16_06790, partial [Flavobacteriales bacterium]